MNITQCLTILPQIAMKNRLLNKFRRCKHKHSICSIYNPNLYIVDWKNTNGGKVEISGAKNSIINSVHLSNEKSIHIFFDGFLDNALPMTNSTYSKQCECVLFPINCDQEEWVLFIETKYAKDISAAQKPAANYPYCMIEQIKATVAYFRNKGIIANDKIVHAIISFPNLMEGFNSWVFPIKHNGVEESILDILINDKIIIRATNKAQIINDKNIRLLS
jgi:hypothetical protein